MGRHSFAGRSLRLVFGGTAVVVSGWMGACADSHRQAILAQGCIINTDCTDPLVCAFQRCHNACESSRDCPAAQRCVASDRPFHVCQLTDESHCDANTYCPQGQVCGVDSQCRDGCTTPRDCVTGQVCVSGTCADPEELGTDGTLMSSGSDASTSPSGLPCSFNSDCPSPLLCRSGTCAAECRTTSDCATGLQCDNSRCVVPLACALGDAGKDPRAGGPCLYSSQCPVPLACVHGYCSCECLGSQDCTPGFACVNSRCQPSLGGANAVEIGPKGGTVTSSDGNLKMQIPEGAIQDSTVFAVRAATAWPSGAVGTVYEVEPSGTRFAKPATIALSYADVALGQSSAADLFVGTAVGAAWQSLGTAVNDPSAETIASTTTHLSVFGLVLFTGTSSGTAGAPNGVDGRGGSFGTAGSSTAGSSSVGGRGVGASSSQGGLGGTTSQGGAAPGGAATAGTAGTINTGGAGGTAGFGGRTATAGGAPPASGGFGTGGVPCDGGSCLCATANDCIPGQTVCCYDAKNQASQCATAAVCKAMGGQILP